MLSAEEVAELRALQERAYGREADLTAADAARLRELETHRAARPVAAAGEPEPVATGVPAASESSVSEAAESWLAEPLEEQGPWMGSGARSGVFAEPPSTDAATQPVAGATNLTLVRAHWRPVALAMVVLLAVGVVAGWALFGRPAGTAVALTPEQQEWQNALVVEGKYDAGSVRAVAVEEGVVVWMATKDERKRTCLILGDGETTAPTCQPADAVTGAGMAGSLVIDEGGEPGQPVREVSASLMITASGEPAVVVNSYEYDEAGMMTYATEEETLIAERLADEGLNPGSIWVVGYDGDVPIWTGTMLDTNRQCLIYDGSSDPIEMSCDDSQLLQEQGTSLVLEHVGDDGGKTTLELSPNYGPTFLVITRERGELGAGGD